MALNGIPIPDTQEIGDSLIFLNSALTALDSTTTIGPLSGDGYGLKYLNASNISAGTVPAVNLPNATTVSRGGVIVGSGLSVSNGTIALAAPAGGNLGGVKQGSNITIAGDGTISATVTPYTLPVATSSILGGVKQGSNITIAGDGTISAATATPYTLPVATSSILGGVKQGSNITIAGDGTISATATPYTLPVATSSVLGGVKIDGTLMSIDANGTVKSPLDLKYSSDTIYWSSMTTIPLVNNYFTSVAMSSSGEVRAAGTDIPSGLIEKGIYLSKDAGFTWSKVVIANDTISYVSIDGTGNNIVAAGNYIYVSNDRGSTFTTRGGNVTYRSVAISKLNPLRITAAPLINGKVYVSNDGGVTFNQYGPTLASLRNIAMSSNGQYQTIISNGASIYVSTNYGLNWIEIIGITGGNAFGSWEACCMSSSGQYQYAINVQNGQLVRSTDFGSTWALVANRPTDIVLGAAVRASMATSDSGAIVYLAWQGAKIYRSTDYGVNWTVLNSNVKDWRTIATSSDGSQITATQGRTLEVSPAIRWTSTHGLSTQFIEAQNGTFTSFVSAPVIDGSHTGEGTNLRNLAAGNITTGTLAAARLPIATSSAIGGVKQGSNITIAADGTISGVNSYTLPAATTTTLGGVIVGSGLSVSGNGTIALAAPAGGNLGGVKQGSNITIAADGTISGVNSYTLPAATTTTLGGVIVGSGLSVSNGNISLNYSLPAASTSTRGGVRVDGTTITVANNDIISVNPSSISNIPSTGINTAINTPSVTTSYTPTLNDRNSVVVITVNSSSESITFNLPTDAEVLFPVGTQITIIQGGSVPINIVPTNTTTVSLQTLGILRGLTTGKNAVATLLKLSANTWLLGGNII